ncbi:MAG: hypothetical protein KGQ66_19600 [Acidobacteriota bacterium]|nr:hypothetical protein [Acidobacteriota bacterium]
MLVFHHEFSHAVNKGPLIQPDGGIVDAMWKREVITPVEPPGTHLALARQALAEAVRLVGPTTYARVDGVDRDDGSPAVLELEPVEPSLFLTTSAGAADRFAAAVSASLGHPPPS